MNDFLDWQVIGHTLNIVGAFFIVNSLVFKRPRRFLFDYFGIDKRRPLSSIRNHVMSQVQLVIGFVFLISGYFLLLADHIGENTLERDSFFSDPSVLSIAAILIVSMLVVTLVLKICQIFWTKWTFKRLLIDFFREHAWALEKYPSTLREVGEILGVEHRKEDSVADYMERVRKALEIVGPLPKPEKGPDSASGIRARTLTPPPESRSTLPHPATPPRMM